MDRLNNLLGVRLARQEDLIRSAQVVIVRPVSVYPGLCFEDVSDHAGREDDVITATTLRIIGLPVNVAAGRALYGVSLYVQVRFRLYRRFLLSVSEVKLYIFIDARRFWDQGRCELRTALLRVRICRNNEGRLTLYRRCFLFRRYRRVLHVQAGMIRVEFSGFRDFLFVFENDVGFVGILFVFEFRLVSGLINAFQVLLMRVIKGLRRYIYYAQRDQGGGGLFFAVNGRFNCFLRPLYETCKDSSGLWGFRFHCYVGVDVCVGCFSLWVRPSRR